MRADKVRSLTRHDLLSENEDLIEAAIGLLGGERPWLHAKASLAEGRLKISVQSDGLDRVDLYCGTRPLISLNLGKTGSVRRTVPASPRPGQRLEFRGFANDKLSAVHRFAVVTEERSAED